MSRSLPSRPSDSRPRSCGLRRLLPASVENASVEGKVGERVNTFPRAQRRGRQVAVSSGSALRPRAAQRLHGVRRSNFASGIFSGEVAAGEGCSTKMPLSRLDGHVESGRHRWPLGRSARVVPPLRPDEAARGEAQSGSAVWPSQIERRTYLNAQTCRFSRGTSRA